MNYLQVAVMHDKGKLLENSRINNNLEQVAFDDKSPLHCTDRSPTRTPFMCVTRIDTTVMRMVVPSSVQYIISLTEVVGMVSRQK